MRPTVPLVSLLTLLVSGCADPAEATTTKTSDASLSTSGGSTGAPGTTTDAPAATTDETPAETTGGPLLTTGGTTGDGGGEHGEKECDVWAQDCPAGQKCTAWADDGSEHWNATHCVPVVDDPAHPGEPCAMTESVASGIDDCAAGSFCWFIDHETLEGVCIESCAGSADAWTCPESQHCDISNDGTLLLCLQTCDPLVPSCPNGQICFNSIDGSTFICDTPNAAVMGMPGMYGAPCDYVNACAYGLFCAYPEEVPGCDNDYGCCSEFCDTGAENTCSGKDGGQQCVGWFDQGEAAPGLEHVGYCTIPQ